MSVVSEPTTFESVLGLLSDGRWHLEHELETVAYFPSYWIAELRASGYDVVTRDSSQGVVVRLQRREAS